MEQNEKWVFSISIILLIVDLITIAILNLTPKITLKEGDIAIELGEEYKEPGYSVFQGYFDITNQVFVTNNINNQEVGSYEVIYQVKYLGKEYKKVRSVKVEDRTKPALTLKGNNPVILCPNKEYIEEGYESIDNYDGDLTEKVKIEKKENLLIYSVEDSSNNKVEVIREIIYNDSEAPTITLNDGNATSLYVGQSYSEPGYIALDTCDGDITSNVKVSGDINTNEAGSYTLTYQITDSSGNSAFATRTVLVTPRPTNNKVIYLTFDDGPSYNITPALLEILKEENVKATFFVLDHGDSLDYLIKRAYDEGHTIALHGATHSYKQIYSSTDAFFNDLEIIQNRVFNVTGKRATIIRFPGGSSNTVSRFNPGIMTTLAKEVKNRGFHYFDWNVDSEDAGSARNSNDVYRNVVNNLKYQHNVVLMHDYSNNYKTLNAIRDIIRYGKENGYTFEAITMSTPEVHHGIAN